MQTHAGQENLLRLSIPDRVPLDEHPPIVAMVGRVDDWEVGLMMGGQRAVPS